MRLLLTISYTNLLFGKGAKTSEIIESLDGAVQVDEKYVEGKTKFFPHIFDTWGESDAIKVRIIPEDSITLPEIKDEKLDALFNIQKKRDESEQKNYSLENKIKELEAKILELTPPPTIATDQPKGE